MRDRINRTLVAMLAAGLFMPALAACSTVTSGDDVAPAQPTINADGATEGPSEGIEVHGRWVIDVINPDGSLANHREFENALAPTGEGLLASLLGRTATPGVWEIELRGPIPLPPCGTGSTSPLQQWPSSCYVTENSNPASGANYYKNLNVNATGGSLELSGNATVLTDGAVQVVRTWLRTCTATTSASTCVGTTPIAFTATSLIGTPGGVVEVTTGQIVQVTVTLSFS